MRGCRPLTDTEVASVTESLGSRDRALFVLGCKTGFRVSELLSLRVGDVLQYGKLVDHVTVQRRNVKKKTQGRTVILHPIARKVIATWLEELGTEDPGRFLFQSRQGGNRPISRVQAYRMLRDAYAANELAGKLGTHSCRKTFAKKVYDALDHDLVKTQRALGHRNVNSTVSYLSFAQSDIDDAILAA